MDENDTMGLGIQGWSWELDDGCVVVADVCVVVGLLGEAHAYVSRM